jgi:predicted enzyme related to lactoylglutathione lyase
MMMTDALRKAAWSVALTVAISLGAGAAFGADGGARGFVWHDLLTEDPAGASRFYGAVFGWEFVAVEDDPGYTLIRNAGQDIGGIVLHEEEGTAGDTDSLWLSWLSVADMDAALTAAERAGAKILDGPYDEPGVGRLVILEDLDGVPVALSRLSEGGPTAQPPAPGRFVWSDLFTPEPARAEDFYTMVAGLDAGPRPEPAPTASRILRSGGTARAGLVPLFWSKGAPGWIPYVGVADVDEAIRRAQKAGGVLLVRQRDTALLRDAVGGTFGIESLKWEGRP